MLLIPSNIGGELRQMLRRMRRKTLARQRSSEPNPPESTPQDPEKIAFDRLQQAGWPVPLLEALPFMDQSTVDLARRVRNLHATGQAIVIINGPTGSGKTSAAALIAYWRAKAGDKIGIYRTAHQFGREINSVNGMEEVARAQRTTMRISWLVIDDIGRAPGWVAEEIAAIIVHRRDHRLPTLIIGAPGAVKRLDEQVKHSAEIVEPTWQP